MDWAFAFILFFWVTRNIPGYRNLFLLSPLNLILTLAIFYKVNKDFSPRF
jgi:hypothetical protein